MADTLYGIEVQDAAGSIKLLSDYAGEVLLIVNVASKCGFTPQYAGLEQLHRAYNGKGFRLLAFPCNDFGGQEPGTMDEIRQFCKLNYDVTFELFAKLHAIGDDRHPLYQWLTQQADPIEDVHWNFEKFLIGKDGKLIERYPSKITPDDPALIAAIEQALRS